MFLHKEDLKHGCNAYMELYLLLNQTGNNAIWLGQTNQILNIMHFLFPV